MSTTRRNFLRNSAAGLGLAAGEAAAAASVSSSVARAGALRT